MTTTIRKIDSLERLALTQTNATERPTLDATLSIKYETDAQDIAIPAQKASAGIIWQCVAIQEHPLLTGQIQKTPAMKMKNNYTVSDYDTGKGLLHAKHTVYSLILLTHLT